MVLQLRVALATTAPVVDMRAREPDSVDLALMYYEEGLPDDYVWPGKLMGDPEKTGFHFIPVGHELCPLGQKYFINNLPRVLTDGKLNLVTGKNPDFLFAGESIERRVDVDERLYFENFAAFFLERLLPHLYIGYDFAIWTPNLETGVFDNLNPRFEAERTLDIFYEHNYVAGKGFAILKSEAAWRNEVGMFLLALHNCTNWGSDRVNWVEYKSPERLQYDRERATRLLLAMDKEQMEMFVGLVYGTLLVTARDGDKDYLVVQYVNDKKLVEYLGSPNVPGD